MKTKRIVIAALVVVALSPATVAHATKYWKNSVITGNWTTGNNWSAVSAAGAENGGVPVAGEAVNIVNTDGTARTVTYDVNAPSLGLLSIDLTGAGTAASTLSMPNNNSLTAAAIAVGGYNGSALTNGRGAVNQSAGTTTISPGWDLILAFGAGSTDTYTLSGGALVANQSEWIGHTGTGTFNHSAGTNTINANGIGAFFVGSLAGSTGTYNLSGSGTLVSNESEYIGFEGTGFFNQTGGANTIGAGKHLYVGVYAGSTGTYTISGGTLSVGADIVVGNSGTGTLTIQNNASVYITNNLSINSISTVNLNGGTLRLNTVGGTGGLSRLNYSAGTIQLAGNHSYLPGSQFNRFFDSGIPSGKGAIVEGNFTLDIGYFNFYYVDGGSLSSTNFDIGTSQFGGGTLNIINGGRVTTTQSANIGTGADSWVTVSGPGSSWNIGDYLFVGGSANATLNILDQGLVYVGGQVAGTALNAVINLNGGTLRFASASGIEYFLNYYSGTIQMAGNRAIGVDATITALFGAAPTIMAEKGLTVEGTATLIATTTLDGGTLTANQLANGHNLRLQRGTLNIKNQVVTIAPGGVLGETLDVNEDMTVNVTLGITNQGLVTGDGQIGGPFANAAAGELRGQAGRSLRLTGSGNTNAGQIKLFGGELEFTQNLTNSAGAFISGNGSLIVGGGLVNQGTMNFAGTANIDGAVTNATGGKIISGGGGATIFYDDVTNNGEIRTSTNGFTVFFGSVSGSGTFTGTGTVNFEGDLSPGSSPAAVSFGGNATFASSSSLNIELGGITPGSQYDQLLVSGALSLGGALDVTLINGFTPSAGQSFNILNWGSLAGTFSSITLPTLAGLSWNTSQLYTTGMLSVAIPGDFNFDGTVDAADYVVWRKNPGTQAEYDTWRGNFGQPTGAGSGAAGSSPSQAAVPEPATLVLLIFAAAGWCLREAGPHRKSQQLLNT